jgi:hypothetical protein
MKTTVWILLGAAVMAGLITTPATADSVCGNRAEEGAEFWHPSVLGKSLREKP